MKRGDQRRARRARKQQTKRQAGEAEGSEVDSTGSDQPDLQPEPAAPCCNFVLPATASSLVLNSTSVNAEVVGHGDD
eukprot:12920221-Prorocentrum_lima.AAC.1